MLYQMKVLLLGNDKFVAEALIKRFLVERYNVILIGSFEKELDKSLIEKIKYYDFSISSRKVEDVFIVNSPDIVVYFNDCQKNLIKEMSYNQSNYHISSLINSHHYSVRGKIKKFIYISTTDLVESCDVSKDYWLNCHSVCENYLNTVETPKITQRIVLRASKLYGQGQHLDSCYICRIIFNKVYETSYTNPENKSEDYIHISDFSNAVVKSFKCKESDTFNVAAGFKLDFKVINSFLDKESGGNKELLKDNKIKSYDIFKTKDKLGFIPLVDIQEEVRSIYFNELASRSDTEGFRLLPAIKRIAKKLADKGQRVINATPFLITILLFLIVIYFTVQSQIPMLHERIDLKILFTLIVAILFGLRYTVFAITLSTLLFLYEYSIIENSVILVLYNQDFYLDIIIMTVIGLGAALLRERNKNLIQELETNERTLNEQLSHLKNMFYDSIKVKDSLEDQVYNTSNSYGMIFSVISKLDSLDFSKLKLAIIKSAEKILRNETLSLYMLEENKQFLRLVSKSKNLNGCENTIEVSEYEAIKYAVTNKDIFINKDIENMKGFVMAAPIIDHGDVVVAVLIMHKAKLENLTLSYINLFKVTASLINQAVVKAYLYEKAHIDKWYIEKTDVLKSKYFNEKVLHQKEIKEGAGIDFRILEINNETNQRLMQKIPKMVRECDYVGLGRNGKLKILLNNVNEDDIVYIQERLLNDKIETRLVRSR